MSEASPAISTLIQSRLLPLLSCLAKEVPLTMSTLFSSELLEKFRLPRTLHWSNLEETDRLFYAINQLYVLHKSVVY